MGQSPDRIETRGIRPGRLAITAAAAFMIMLAVILTDARADQHRQSSAARPADASSPASLPSLRSVEAPRPVPVLFRPRTGAFRADGLEGKLPSAWFTRQNAYITIGTGVGGCFGNSCRQSIAGQHPVEDNIPWGADFEVVNVDDALAGSDLDRTADNILSFWTLHTYLSTDAVGPVRVREASRRTLTTNLPRPARLITAELHYDEPEHRDGYRHFYLLVVGGTARSNTAFVATWTDNVTPAVGTSIQDAINSLQVV